MKLHLPKQLFTALLAVLTLAAPAAWGLEITGSGDLEVITLKASQSYDGANFDYTVAGGIGVTTSLTQKENNATNDEVEITFTLNNNSFKNVTYDNGKDSAKIVWVKSTTGDNKIWGFAAYNANTNDNACEVTGMWEGNEWKPNSTNWTTGSETGNTYIDISDSATTTTYTATIGENGTILKDAASTAVYNQGGLKASGDGVRLESVYINSAFVSTFQAKEYSTLTFSNGNGNWSKSYTRTELNNAVSSVMEVGLAGVANAYDIVAGGSGGLVITAAADEQVTVSNTLYLASAATNGGAVVSITNDGAVNLNGPVYLVEDSKISTSSGAGIVTFGGKVTDKGVPTGSENATVDGAYTLSLSGTGYNFAGGLDVTGLSQESGASVSISSAAVIGTLNAAEATVIMNAGASLSYTSGSIGSLTSNGSADNTNEITLAGNEATLNRVTTGHVTLNGSGVYYAGTVNNSNSASANPGLGTVTLGNSWDGYVAYTGGGGSAALANLDSIESKLLFKGVQGHISANFDRILKLENGTAGYALQIQNGSSNASETKKSMATFTQAICGSGTMEITWNNDSNYTGFTMQGSLAEWIGKLDQKGRKKFNLILDDAANVVNAELDITGSGELNVYVETAADASFNKTVDITNLTLSQTAAFNSSLNVRKTAVVDEGKTLTLGGGTAEAPVAHSIATLNATAGTVSLEANANLTLGGGTAETPLTHSIGTLNAAAGSTLTLNNASSLTLGTASTIAGNVTGAGNIASNYATTFSGDVSGWTGSFTNGAAMTLTFNGSASAVNAAITQTTGNLNLTVGTTAAATFGGAVTANQINVNQSTTFNGAVTATTMQVGSSDKTVAFAGSAEHVIASIDPKSYTGINYNVAAGASLKVQQNMWMKNSSINLAGDAVFSHDAQKLEVIGTGNGSTIRRDEGGDISKLTVDNSSYTISNAEVNMSNSTGATLGMLLTQSSLTTKGSGLLTVSNSDNTITNLAAESGNVKLSASMAVDSISVKNGKVVTVSNGSTIAMGGGAVSIGTNSADATMTARSDNALAQLQQDASFTIEDMTLTNTTVTAATAETRVNLQNVEATNLALAQGKFTMNAAPTVGTGGTTAEFGSGVVSLLTAGSASLTLNMDVIGVYESTGAVDNVTLTITLAGITGDVSSYGVGDWKALVGFEEQSWLGQALTGAEYTVSETASAAEGGVPSVNYGYASTGSNVGTLTITITGLNVPEPATSTLSLAALMMLCARRRRKA